MRFRSMILVLTIAFSAIFVTMIGTSYAYYVATSDIKINVTTADIDTGVAVLFEQSQYINLNTGIPINEEDINSLASTAVFTINPDNSILSDTEVSINIGIVDIYMDDELMADDFKYRLSCNDGSRDVVTFNGSGAEFTSDVIDNDYFKFGSLSTVLDTFDVNKDYTCTLRFWIQESGENQNSLMNKRFHGLIRVNTLFKK